VLAAENGDPKEVHCLPPAAGRETDVRRVGSALREGVVVVDLAVQLRDVVALLVESRNGVIVVADQAGQFAGVIHESHMLPELLAMKKMKDFSRHDFAHLTLGRADEAMVRSVSVSESKPLREVLLEMASSHSRCLIAVSGTGVPVGVLRDVDALHALFGTDNA
jgi:predicted transcriptional regulator